MISKQLTPILCIPEAVRSPECAYSIGGACDKPAIRQFWSPIGYPAQYELSPPQQSSKWTAGQLVMLCIGDCHECLMT